VAVVSGRLAGEVRELVGVPEVEVFGLYGIEGDPSGGVRAALPAVERISRRVAGAWVEDKGATLAVHYRQAPDPSSAHRELEGSLQALARDHGLVLLRGKLVLELAPMGAGGKGAVILRECRGRGLEACLYAGDDRADLDAFAALEELGRDGLGTVKVAVRSEETPEDLISAADMVVEGPSGLIGLLAQL
jgi:trehalose 6-phosphate phosphatase